MIKENRKELVSALSFLGKAISSRTTMPILQSIKAELLEGKLILRASNLTITLSKTLEVTGNDSWTTCVPYDKLKDISGIDTGEELVLSFEKDVLTVIAGKSKTRIKCLDEQEFPLITLKDFEKRMTIDAETLNGCIKRIEWAAQTNESLVITNSVYFNANDTLKLASMNGAQMSIIDTGKSVESPFTAIVPLRAIAPLSELSGMADILLSSNQIAFQDQDTLIISQLVDGMYIPYEGHIKKEHTTFVTVYPQEVVQALKVADTFAKENAHMVQLDISQEEQRISVGSRAVITGEGTTDVDALIEGESLQIFFNAQSIRDALEHAAARCKICLDGNRRQAMIYTEPQDGWIAAVAPMNVQKKG